MRTQTSRPADAAWNPQTQGSGGKEVAGPEAWGSTKGPAKTSGPRHFTELQRRPMEAQDAKLRRCWFDGSWVYGLDDCTVCGAWADRDAFMLGVRLEGGAA